MKRWKKRMLVALTAFIGCGVLAYLFRFTLGSLLITVTLGAFDPSKTPPAPDYAEESAWAALPNMEDPSDRLPEGFEDAPSPTRDLVDVFYIYPTGIIGTGNWNATVGEEQSLAIPVSVMLAVQASAFNGCGQVYAPKYRQANLAAFIGPLIAPQRTDSFQALDLAYEDVARAFDYYLAHYNAGKPFIIASHSQGTHHALRLLAEKIDGTPLYDQLIAAYAIGYGIPMDYFGRVFHDIVPCESPTQTGCLITWDTVREGTASHSPRVHRYPDGWTYSGGKPRFCVNPLTWTTGEERAPASLHAGALTAELVPEDVRADRVAYHGISEHHTWAEIHDGQLWVADQAGTVFDGILGVYHTVDFNLFWMNIRENAQARAEAYLRTHHNDSESEQFLNLQETRISCLGISSSYTIQPQG